MHHELGAFVIDQAIAPASAPVESTAQRQQRPSSFREAAPSRRAHRYLCVLLSGSSPPCRATSPHAAPPSRRSRLPARGSSDTTLSRSRRSSLAVGALQHAPSRPFHTLDTNNRSPPRQSHIAIHQHPHGLVRSLRFRAAPPVASARPSKSCQPGSENCSRRLARAQLSQQTSSNRGRRPPRAATDSS